VLLLKAILEVNWRNRDRGYSYLSLQQPEQKAALAVATDLALGRNPSKHRVSRYQDPTQISAVYYSSSVSSAALSWQ